MVWLLLVTSLSGDHGALRLRLWRALKAAGAAVLRDGVYFSPATDAMRAIFEEQAQQILASGGSAYVLPVHELPERDIASLLAMFDRTSQYDALIESMMDFALRLQTMAEIEARRALRQLTREFTLIEATDFFPSDARNRASAALLDAETKLINQFSPDEPRQAAAAPIPRLNAVDFQSRLWATRAHLWVDRVASAWLIRRFIDRRANFTWIEHVADCPTNAIGFDFDGATFTHVGEKVTFEVLLASFGLDTDDALVRLAALVRQLDIGGGRVAEAAGFEAMLTGARERCKDDDALLRDIGLVLDDLYHAFSKTNKGEQ